MSYCVNPHCLDRTSTDGLEQCPACQTPLTIHGRYRILHPLCERKYAATEVFRVIDLDRPAVPLVLKTLIHEDAKLQSLFQREQILLMQVAHPGIPRGYDTFDLTLKQGQTIDCLVMEYIAGDNLEQWVKQHGAISANQAINWLKQLLNTLEYIHQQQVFHRDIKPSNIMRKSDGTVVLIDFGSTRQITDTILSDRTRTTIVSFGYTPPEQLGGKAVPQSDFYALGKTLMYLLSGQDVSSPQTFVSAQAITPSFQKLLQLMTMETVAARPNNTQNILRRLRKIEREAMTTRRRQIGLGFIAGALCGGSMMVPLIRQINWDIELNQFFSKATCDLTQSNNISCGEKSLLRESDLQSLLGSNAAVFAGVKQSGIQYFKEKKWIEAQKHFTEVWTGSQDPEALIYLNNVKIHRDAQLQKRHYTIAVVAPLDGSQSTINRGLNILRGVAMAQTQALETGLGLQVILVDDRNNPDLAAELAQELVQRRQVLAVIGHHVSDATKSALKIYDRHKMVLISSTSTSQDLDTYASRENNIFFRTVASDRVTAMLMADFLRNTAKIDRVAVFYNPDKSYSRSLAIAFKKNFQIIKGEVVENSPDRSAQFYLSCTNCTRSLFQVKPAIEYAKSKGAKAFVVIPDAAETGSNAMTDAINLIRSAGNIPIVTGDTMAGEIQLLDPQIKTKIYIASNWELSQNPNSPLVKFWQPKSATEQSLTWPVHTTYNATQVLITAMNNNHHLNRSQLRDWIASSDFNAPGSSGQVSFSGGELQQPQITLTQIVQCNTKKRFQAMNTVICE